MQLLSSSAVVSAIFSLIFLSNDLCSADSTIRPDHGEMRKKYIVQMKDDETHHNFCETSDFKGKVDYVYKHARLLAMTLTEDEVEEMTSREDVLHVELDNPVHLLPPHPSEPSPATADGRYHAQVLSASEVTPYGIPMVQALNISDDKIGNITVCITDTGYDLGHEDLQQTNVTGWSYFGENQTWYNDGGGHGKLSSAIIPSLKLLYYYILL